MATTSQWGVVVDALTAQFTAAGIAFVFDGLPLTDDAATEFTSIGWDGGDADEAPAAQVDQVWAGLGAHRKDERATIPCAVVVSSGDPILKTVRDRALVIFGLLETAFRADPTLGVLSPPAVAEMSSFTPYQYQNDDGTAVRLAFTVSYMARI